ncbi:alkaline phosphatase D family protein [Hyphomonas sp. NPDC076900]|uniref:alkaline phosphatase D family protein n=1 Tax=unclassified Hyphomonas TaxID=2630699 RepID=UPI003D081098
MGQFRTLAVIPAAILALASCQTPAPATGIPASQVALLPDELLSPASAEAALELYYRTLPEDFFPRAPRGLSLPGDEDVLTRLLVGSCFNEETPDGTAMSTVAAQEADLFLMIGDNVYGDMNGRAYVNNQATLDELRESFSDLAARPEFQALRAKHPMMVAWDDHDYGANDAGREFPFRRLAERIHERFWGLENEDVGAWPGTYYARSFGPQGQRVQIIMLDTRFFRSPLEPTDEWGKKGKERYVPSTSEGQDMLGNDQWTWLENQLQEEADLRLIVSSIQVMTTDGHGFEAWSRLPAEQERLYRLVAETEAEGVVFVSGDRHTAFLYKDEAALPYPAYEITASSMNVSMWDTSGEVDRAQIGPGYAPNNFGAIEIDWESGTVRLAIKSDTGDTVNEVVAPFRRAAGE